MVSDSVQSSPVIERVDAWDRFPWLRAGFSTRQGGRSQRYGRDELNLGWTAEDDAADVAENRSRFVDAVSGGAALGLVTANQIHSETVWDLGTQAGPVMTPEGKAMLRGDGLVSGPGTLVGVVTADCVPVLVADTRTRAVGAFHAGWRGTLARIVEGGVEALREGYGSRPEDLIAAIGPCIRPCCFEVGHEVRESFVAQCPRADDLFSASGPKPHMDLVEANRRQLLEAGVPQAAISVVGECTACARLDDGRRRYFSYRVEGGVTGRMLSVIGAVAE